MHLGFKKHDYVLVILSQITINNLTKLNYSLIGPPGYEGGGW